MDIKELGKWEYNCLNRDLKLQGDKPIDMKFNDWYNNVFLIDEAWEEIRNNHFEEQLIKLAEDLNKQYSKDIAEPDVNYFPPNTFEDCLDVFFEEVEKQFPNINFEKDYLQDIFSDCWTGKYIDGDEGDYDD